MNANGEMNPCHRPSQKPATTPFGPGLFLKTFGPAAQPAAKHTVSTRKRPKRATSGIFTVPPQGCEGMLGEIATSVCTSDEFEKFQQ